MTSPDETFDEAVAPHSAAERDTRDPSRATNQPRAEPVPPTPAHDDMPSAASGDPDTATDVTTPRQAAADRPQAGVPERAVTDVTPAPGTSEATPAAEAVHTPDVGPGGAQFDTDEPAVPNRNTGSR